MGNLKMKLIVTLSVLLISLSAITCVGNAFDKKWCGNSKVDVEITTEWDGKKEKTHASIVVPTTLSEVSIFDNKVAKLIQKTEQGLVLTLDGKANAKHLGVIYNYDEDDNTQIFIPYLYLSSITPNMDILNVNMARTFAKVENKMFNIVPVVDAFGTPLCECQQAMLLERIQQNLTKRLAILAHIAKNISSNIVWIAHYNAEITKWTNWKPNKTLRDSLTKQATNKDAECSAFQSAIEQLNAEIMTEVTSLAGKNEESVKNDSKINWATDLIDRGSLETTWNYVDKDQYSQSFMSGKPSGDTTYWKDIQTYVGKALTQMQLVKLDYLRQYPQIEPQIVSIAAIKQNLETLSKKEKLDLPGLNINISGVQLVLTKTETLLATKISS